MRPRFLALSMPLLLPGLWLGLQACSSVAPPQQPAPPVADAAKFPCKVEHTAFDADSCTLVSGGVPDIDSELWPDICDGGFGWAPSQGSFDQLAWRNFLYAAWPATRTGGPVPQVIPDGKRWIGDQAGGEFLPAVFESFHSRDQMLAWGQGQPPLPAGCSAEGPPVLRLTSKVPPEAKAAAAAAHLSEVDQAFHGPLVDQNGNLVYYDIRINDREFQAIVELGRAAQVAAGAQWARLPAADRVDGIQGGVEAAEPGRTAVRAVFQPNLPGGGARRPLLAEVDGPGRAAPDPQDGPLLPSELPFLDVGDLRARRQRAGGRQRPAGAEIFVLRPFVHGVAAAQHLSQCRGRRRRPEIRLLPQPRSLRRPATSPAAPTPNQITALAIALPETQNCNKVYRGVERSGRFSELPGWWAPSGRRAWMAPSARSRRRISSGIR